MDNITIKDSYQGMEIEKSQITKIKASEFNTNGNLTLNEGGGIHITDSIVTIEDTSFIKNKAKTGAAIYFNCVSMNKCSLNINETDFESNMAQIKGGAIYYGYGRPTFEDNIQYTNNSAQYGPNVAGYPVKITFQDDTSNKMSKRGLGSGIRYNESMHLALRDYEDQVMVLENINQISLFSVNSSESTVKGFNSASLKSGVAEFDNFIVSAEPGSEGIEVRATSKAIDDAKVANVFGTSIGSSIISVTLRYCQPGESISGIECSTCSAGTYSLFWNSTECTQWVDSAVCEGGAAINVNPGYWRKSTESTSIVECINKDAWNGGYQDIEEAPTNWATGYEGNLWTKWRVYDDKKYQEVGNFQCAKWPAPVINALRVFGAGWAVFLYFMMIIVVNVRKTSESQFSVLLRILTNYAQLITTTVSFSTKYPDSFTDILVPVSSIGDSSDVFMSFDWFVTDYEIKGPFPSNAFFKLFLIIFLPLILFALVALIWIVIHWKKRYSKYNN